MTIGFVTARRWPDLAPPDLLARDALRRLGVRVLPVIWDEQNDWRRFDALVLRSTWDYPEKVASFRAWLNEVEAAGTLLINSAVTVRWNLDKHYLAELHERGVPIVETHFAQPGERLDAILRDRNWSHAVVKPRISADGYRTFLTTAHTAHEDEAAFAELRASPNGVMVQAFLSQVREAGEASFVFLGGRFSHAALKRPATGDFRVQERFGGTLESWEPGLAQVQRVEAFLEAVPVPWVYARVDVCPLADALLVMEIELIEPSLLFDRAAPSAADRFAQAVLLAAERA